MTRSKSGVHGSPRSPRPLRGALARGRRLYKAYEDAIGPRLPRPVRSIWRRLVGRPPLSEYEQPLASSLRTSGTGRFDVVCFPITAWEFRFQRPQQLMRELARRGHRVFWIDLDAVRSPSTRPLLRELEPRLFEVALPAAQARDPFREDLREDDLAPLLEGLAALEREQGIVGAVAVVELPFWSPLALRAANRLGWRLVYDCMDDHAAFSTNSPAMLASEHELVQRSDLVVASSRRLHERLAVDARRTARVPNACDFDHFHRATEGLPAPAALASLPRPIIGYFGAISEWFDFDLLADAIRSHPEWSFALIGSTWGAPEHGELAQRTNVHLLGEQPYAELPAYLAQMDVALIPFRLTPLTEATDPVKLYEYLAAGKPVVSSHLPELAPLGELVYRAGSPRELTDAAALALREDGAERRARRIAFARRNSWRERVDRLEAAIETTFPLASVIVVTWNNLELTRRCLKSVLADRSWPRLEVVVVDNASSDDTRAYLQALAAREPAMRFVLNDDNRGFAAANNQGLAVARGEYVVLLNNDTLVPRGWLARLIRILDSDARIGLLGPVTDGVWNEARVDAALVPGEDFDGFAAAWARQHAGRLYPIGMLAMYCVAARRAVIDAVGPLDERFGIGMFEDDDYAHRVREAGFRLACTEEVFVHHAGQASFDKLAGKSALWEENRRKFESKWATTWRAPGLGTRARILTWRERVDRVIAEHASGHAPVVLLIDASEADASARPLIALAEELARAGHLLLDVREPATEESERRLDPLGTKRFASTLPLEAFENVVGAIVLATTGRRFDLAYFAEPRVVYAPGRPPGGSSPGWLEARRALLARASLVIASPGEVDDGASEVPSGCEQVAPGASAHEILSALARASASSD